MSKCDVYGSHESFEFNCISTVFSFRYVLTQEEKILISMLIYLLLEICRFMKMDMYNVEIGREVF